MSNAPDNKKKHYPDCLGRLHIHYDVEGEEIPGWQFIDAIQAIYDIIDDINKNIFDEKLEYEIVLHPPKRGTFLIDIGMLLGNAWVVMKILETDIAKSYIEGLTGEKPEYWSRDLGQKTRSASDLVSKLVKGFLESTGEKIKEIGISKKLFANAIRGKNKIYEDCLNNKDVKGVGFDKTPYFPIKRKDITKYILEAPQDDEDICKWIVEEKDIIVNSPNWERGGRSWQAVYDNGKKANFKIYDDEFWNHVKNKDINPDIKDRMRVQWARPAGACGNKTYKVLKVITYNDKILGDPLSSEEIDELLGSNVEEHKESSSLDLFSSLSSNIEKGERR